MVVEVDEVGEDLERTIGTLLEKLTEEERIALFSELEYEEIERLVILCAINEKLNSPILNTYIQTFLKLRVSLKRKGRKELVSVSKALARFKAEMSKPLLSRLKTWGRDEE